MKVKKNTAFHFHHCSDYKSVAESEVQLSAAAAAAALSFSGFQKLIPP